MTKKDYEKAAAIVRRTSARTRSPSAEGWLSGPALAMELCDAFVELFASDNPRFDEARFRQACSKDAKRNPTGQPKWKLLMSTDYSAIFVDETDEYAAEMMIAQEYEDERGKTKFVIYRFPLDKLQKVEDEDGKTFIVSDAWEPSWQHPLHMYQEWFVKDLAAVASSHSTTKKELVEALTSDDIGARAWAYESIGGHHGFDNFDSYPETWSEKQMEERWP